MRWVLVALVILVVLAAVVAIKLLPWWAILVGFIVGVLAIVLAIKLLMHRLLVAPFLAKGRVLKGATMVVHSNEPGEAPAWDDEHKEELRETGAPETDEELAEELAREKECEHAFYWIEATITPREPKGGFTHWEPSELVLMPPEANAADIDAEDVGGVFETYVWIDGQFREDEDGKYPGEQRVRLLVGIEPTMQRAKFRYYLCDLCDVEFPSPPPPTEQEAAGQVLPPPVPEPPPE
jgi:hypothetical protein